MKKFLTLIFIALAFVVLTVYVTNVVSFKNSGESDVVISGSGFQNVYMLLHGIPTSPALFSQLTELIGTDQNARILIPYLSGDSINQDTEYISSIFTDHTLENVILIGHDRGGIVATQLLQIHPDKIKSLVLLSTPLEPITPPYPQNIFGHLLVSFLYGDLHRGFPILGTTLSQGGIQDSQTKKNILSELRSNDLKHIRSFFLTFSETNNIIESNKEILKKTQVPVSIIWGENDSFLPKEHHLKNLTSDAHVISGGTHYTPTTNAREIYDFLIK